jgi:hypothetical protein
MNLLLLHPRILRASCTRRRLRRAASAPTPPTTTFTASIKPVCLQLLVLPLVSVADPRILMAVVLFPSSLASILVPEDGLYNFEAWVECVLGALGAPGKRRLAFNHILNRLQVELQKSCETGAELHNLTGVMNDIHNTLGGSLVSR